MKCPKPKCSSIMKNTTFNRHSTTPPQYRYIFYDCPICFTMVKIPRTDKEYSDYFKKIKGRK